MESTTVRGQIFFGLYSKSDYPSSPKTAVYAPVTGISVSVSPAAFSDHLVRLVGADTLTSSGLGTPNSSDKDETQQILNNATTAATGKYKFTISGGISPVLYFYQGSARLNLCGKRVVCRAVGFYGVAFGSFAVNALVRNFNYFMGNAKFIYVPEEGSSYRLSLADHGKTEYEPATPEGYKIDYPVDSEFGWTINCSRWEGLHTK